jgi:mRNA-degrading endonuclease RelE of RelBE toxin-antitoxin system
MKYECLGEFDKDLKKLSKRFRSLLDDLEVLKKFLAISPAASPPNSFLISNLNALHEIIKVKKFACKALKGRGANSGIRIVYAFHKDEHKFVFIEIYFKGDKEREDRSRILKYYSAN